MTFLSDVCVMGLDLSLSQSGWAVDGGSDLSYGVIKAGALRGAERLVYIRRRVYDLVQRYGPGLLVIEGYAFGARGRLADIGELGGVVRVLLHVLRLPYIVVAPTLCKKFVTGSGSAGKDAMMMYCLKHGWAETQNNNEADAVGLAKFGRCFAGVSEASWSKVQRDVVEKFLASDAGRV